MPNPETLNDTPKNCETCRRPIVFGELYYFDPLRRNYFHRPRCPIPAAATLESIRLQAGSFRRMMESYWTGGLTPEQEAVIEDKFPKETLVSYRPVAMTVVTAAQAEAAVSAAGSIGRTIINKGTDAEQFMRSRPQIPHLPGCDCLLCKNGIR